MDFDFQNFEVPNSKMKKGKPAYTPPYNSYPVAFYRLSDLITYKALIRHYLYIEKLSTLVYDIQSMEVSGYLYTLASAGLVGIESSRNIYVPTFCIEKCSGEKIAYLNWDGGSNKFRQDFQVIHLHHFTH